MIQHSSNDPRTERTESVTDRSSAQNPANGDGALADNDRAGAQQQSNLTLGQQQIWMGQNLLPELPIYHLAVALTIRGEIDPVHFTRAFQTLVNSSDALRTVVEEMDGIPLQRTLPDLPCAMTVVDLSSQPDAGSQAKSWMRERCQSPLNGRECLFDSALVKLSRDHWIWYLNVHHLICDGWSFELIYRYMADLYRRSLQGDLPAAVDLFPYGDYLDHERVHRQSARHRRSEAYWKKFLAEGGEELDFYGKSPVKTTTAVRRLSWDLGSERTSKLRAAVPQAAPATEQASLLQVFAAITVAFLHCLNGKSKYAVGIPFHNRRSKNFKETIGFFTEVLPIRLEVSEDDTFRSLIGKVKAEVFNAARHGQCSPANSHFQRFYEVVLNYHTRSFSDFAGMPALPEWVHSGHGDDSLVIQLSDFASSSSLSVDFDLHRDVFDERDGERVAGHFARVLDEFLADPEQPLRNLSLISPEEKEAVLRWGDGGVAPMDGRTVHELIEEQAESRPEAPAVVFENQDLSYGDLNHRANQLGRYLQMRGVGPGSLVGLYVERSFELAIGLLGILKAGAAYVPIHPEFSPAWVKFVLEDTGAKILLTQERLRHRLPSDGPEIFSLDGGVDVLTRQPGDAFDSRATARDLAYVIYTSGTMGTPKGVEITHGAMANFAVQAASIFELGHTDRVLQFASPAFDTSAEEIFPCLLRGAALVLRSEEMLASPEAFLGQCADWGITVLDLPTVYWHELTAALYPEGLRLPAAVRLVIIGGDKALPERLAQWQACVSRNVRLLNTYGPTEATVAATFCDLTDAAMGNKLLGNLPIGKPLPNMRTYVLDRNMSPVPIGATGELWIGGAGVASGYWKQPLLTAERFLPDPFSAEPESRLYRTGDRARYRPDGNLEFLGRIDRQIKIRGFRVELDAIEAALKKHPLVGDAAVLNDAAEQHSLTAYLVAKGGALLNEAEIKNFIRSRLADYMVPAKIVIMDALPLTHSGKVDRRALKTAGAAAAPLRAIEPPRTSMEARIAEIWSEVLGVREVGRTDGFFEIGGQSLLAAQIVSRLRKELGLEIPLRLIFESPTVADLAERIDEISRRGDDRADLTPVSTVARGEPSPLSQSQARLWYMHQLAPESAAYNISAPVRFTGVLHKVALARALEAIVRRHDSLRTTFRNGDGVPVQIVSPNATLAMPEIDLRTIPEARRASEARRILSEEARRPFDLEKGPLIRVLLLRLGDEEHVLLMNMHHVISDQWSLGVMARELADLYNGYCNSTPPSINGSQPQYADFAIWQDQWLTRERVDAQLAYWKKQLANLEPLALPADYRRPPAQTFRGDYQSFDLSAQLVAKLKRYAAREQATLYMIFLAAFKALLYRYSGQQDIAIGSPIANRNRLEWEGIVGTFINILVLRTDLSGNPSLRQALQRVREVVLEAFTYQDLPFETLVRELQPQRDPSRSPLIQVLFNFQSVALENARLNGLSWAPFEIDQSSSQFDLSVTVDPEITRKVLIAYNTDLYDSETVSRMLGHYGRLLEAVAANPDQSIAAVSILGDGERRRIVHEWNDNAVAVPLSCVHELFATQAVKTPDAVAVEFEDRRISYRDMDRRADQVARCLRALGVGPEVMVGVCVERSPDLVAALLGVWKAGGAYVPVDPAYPAERISFMLEDSGMAVLLTEEKLLRHLPRNGHKILCLDTIADETTAEATELSALARPSNLAYVIYTSGSTGRPKGVEVEHRSLVNFLQSMRKQTGMTERDVLLSVTTISFDIAALEIFLPLVIGARVVLTSRETAADGSRLMRRIAGCGATMMQATPTTWRMLTEAGWKGNDGFKILCGGEPFPLDLVEHLLDGRSEVWNLYGPTETTVWSTAYRVQANRRGVPIGRPIDNTRIYILDSNMELVPIGVPGELFIGGQGVARGYLKRPELTAEKFVRDPYCADADARLFRTGDLARYLSDGNVECLGRLDQQLKIRGHRIEPGEIETALTQHPAVRQAAVVGQECGPAEKRLIAYLVIRREVSFDGDELRGYLSQKLPDYMLPSAFVFLEALPIAPGGKVRRQALPLPDPSGFHRENTLPAPRDRLEFQLAQIWRAVLKVKPIGIRDSFFHLGGDSLTTVKLTAEIKKRLCVELPVATVFSAPTIEQLAKVIRAEGWIPPRNCLIEIKPQGSHPPLFLIGVGNELAAYFDPDQPVYELSFVGMFERKITPTSVREIASSYIESIRSIQPEGPYYLAGYSSGGILAFETAQLLESRGEKIALLALLDAYGPRSRPVPIGGILRAHWRAFRARERWARLEYAGHVWKRAASFVALPARRAFWRMLHRSFLSGGPIPVTAVNLSMAYDFAFRDHAAQVYRGGGVLLRSSEARAGVSDAGDRGWTGLFTGGLEIHDVPGGHASMLQEPDVRGVAERLGECLRRAQFEAGGTDPRH